MYLTINTIPHQKAVDFNWIMNNPFAFDFYNNSNTKKVTIEIKDSYAEKLYNNSTAQRTAPALFHTLPYEDIPNSYRHCRIPKKSNPNKMRELDIPNDTLKNIQSYYKHYIEDTLHTLPHTAAYAYVKGRDIIKANQMHQSNESNWFLQIDLKDFFPSINEEFLRRMLLQVYPFKFIPEEHFENIINYALLNNSIPQGSPLSPTITNILMVPIDYAITKKLQDYDKKNFIYTRYADDIKISCKQHFDPKKIVQVILDIFKEFDAPLKINHDKTRYGSRAGKNYYLGVILNKDNQISPGWRNNKKLRAKLFDFVMHGTEWDPHEVHKMLGIIAYYKNIEPEFIKKTIDKYNNKYSTDIIAKAKQLIS